ncbi:MAG: hypothetical protein LBQ57_10905 [Spirochaetales bacterium]|jgi:hypothetical protein|nr:hypothetical protein [Spirochaetales bacterium]
MKRILPCLFWFVSLLSAVPGHCLDFFQDAGFRGAVLLSQQGDFGRKPQGSTYAEFQNVLSGESFAALLSLGYHKVNASNLSGGWGYRGFEGVHLWLGAEWYLFTAQNVSDPPPGPRFGVSLAYGGFYSVYQYTDILFFYTALRLDLFADLFFSLPFHLRIGIPAEVYFRRDLDSCYAVGFGVWGGISWSRLAGGLD